MPQSAHSDFVGMGGEMKVKWREVIGPMGGRRTGQDRGKAAGM
jgi:hypothetical protein